MSGIVRGLGGSISDRQLFFTVGILLLCGVFGSDARKEFKRDARKEQANYAHEHFTLATRYLYFPAFLDSATRKSLESDRRLSFRIHGKRQIHLADHRAKLWAHDDGELVYWNIEKHLWKCSTERNEVTELPAKLSDVKVGKTLKSWRAEPRPINCTHISDCSCKSNWPMTCGRHILRSNFTELLRRRGLGRTDELEELVAMASTSIKDAIAKAKRDDRWTWDEVPRVPVAAPTLIAYGEPIQGETVAQFRKRWNATLSPTEKKELRPLSDFVMMKSRRPLTDDLPAVPDRRTKVSNTKQPMTPKQEETFLALQKQLTVQETAKLCISLNVRPLDAARLTKQSYPAIRKAVVRLNAEKRKNDVLILRVPVGHQDESQVA